MDKAGNEDGNEGAVDKAKGRTKLTRPIRSSIYRKEAPGDGRPVEPSCTGSLWLLITVIFGLSYAITDLVANSVGALAAFVALAVHGRETRNA